MAQKLEAEDAEQRQKRLQNILERLNGDAPSDTTSEPLSFDFGDRRTFGVEPPTELLARVQQFLPQIEQSNEELLHRDPQSIDMEHIEETDERVIQMNLGLGVFEQRRASGNSSSSAESGSDASDSEEDTSSSSSSTSTSTSSSSSSTDSDSEDDEDTIDHQRNTQREIRPLPSRARPLIQVLPSGDDGGALLQEHARTGPAFQLLPERSLHVHDHLTMAPRKRVRHGPYQASGSSSSSCMEK